MLFVELNPSTPEGTKKQKCRFSEGVQVTIILFKTVIKTTEVAV